MIGYPLGYSAKAKSPGPAAIITRSDSNGLNYAESFLEPIPPVLNSVALPFTHEQCQQILSLINSQSASSEGSTISSAKLVHSHSIAGKQPFTALLSYLPDHSAIWIIDTGASNHMINSVSLFSSYITLCHSTVKLPDGQSATVSFVGTVSLSPTLVLKNVLCVPSFISI